MAVAKQGKMPFFVAAPRCVISFNGSPIAYAVGISMSVSTVIEPVRILGAFAPVSFEPLMVNPVRGSLQIVRLLSATTRTANAEAAAATFGEAANAFTGDAEDKFTAVTMQSSIGGADSSILGQTALYRHLDPVSVLLSQSFDIDIQIKIPISSGPNPLTKDKFDSTTKILGAGDYTLQATNFIRIKDARLSGGRGSITPGALFRESFTFEGLYAVTHFSGDTPMQGLDVSWKESPGGV
jgi:hypothetical protein